MSENNGGVGSSAPLWQAIQNKVAEWGGNISVYTALGSFALYVLGYLTLRFELTALGVVTDLPILDERYLFAGARFLVYLVTSVPIVLMLGAPFLPILWLLRKHLETWSAKWNLALAGVVFSVLFIQLVARKCFQFMNAPLLGKTLEGDSWLRAVLLDDGGGLESLFFSALLFGIAVSAGLLIGARRNSKRHPWADLLLGFLIVVQFLLLPVNYAVVIASSHLPRVASFAGSTEAWLVWEGSERLTFLVNGDRRALVTVPRGDVKDLTITGFEHVRRRLFVTEGTP